METDEQWEALSDIDTIPNNGFLFWNLYAENGKVDVLVPASEHTAFVKLMAELRLSYTLHYVDADDGY